LSNTWPVDLTDALNLFPWEWPLSPIVFLPEQYGAAPPVAFVPLPSLATWSSQCLGYCFPLGWGEESWDSIWCCRRGGRGAGFLVPSLVITSFLSHSWLLLNLTGLNWGQLETQKRHWLDRQKVASGMLGAWVEMPNPNCFSSLSLRKVLLLAVL
jgi:hypothetical protein